MSIEITSIMVSVGSLILAGLALLRLKNKDTTELENRITKLESKEDNSKRIDEACERIKALEVKSDLVWGAVEKTMIDILHHPTETQRDTLLEKLSNRTINLMELEELENILKDIIIVKEVKEEAIAASLLLARTKQIIFDSKRISQPLGKC